MRITEITWEDKLHDKMTSAYSKSCGYKKFSVHTNTKKYRFQIVPLWRAFSKSSVFVDLFMRISVDGRRIRNNKVAFSNLSGIVWTGFRSARSNLHMQWKCSSLVSYPPPKNIVVCFAPPKKYKSLVLYPPRKKIPSTPHSIYFKTVP